MFKSLYKYSADFKNTWNINSSKIFSKSSAQTKKIVET